MSDGPRPLVVDDFNEQNKKPLLSPKGSQEDDGDLHIPDAKVRHLGDDTASGFTGSNYPMALKSENQARLDSFLIDFRESAGTKLNERKDAGVFADDSDD